MRKAALSMSAVIALLFPLGALAAVPAPTPRAPAAAAIIPVQGWWDPREAHELQERYYRLPPPARDRYDRLEAQIHELQHQQREILEGHWQHYGPPPPGYGPYGPYGPYNH